MHLLIVFIAMAYKVMNKFQMSYINAMIAVIMLLTMMRPYYIVLFLIPIYVLARNERKTACVLSGIGGVAALAGYALISKYLCASYFGTSVVGMGLTPDDFQEGVWEGIKTIIKTLLRGVQMTFYWISTTFSDGSYQGRMLIVLFAFFFAVIILAVQKRKEKVKLVWLGYWIIYFVIRYMAIILLYNRNISDAAIRHMFDFILIGIIIFSMEASKKVFTYIQCFIWG